MDSCQNVGVSLCFSRLTLRMAQDEALSEDFDVLCQDLIP